MIEFLFLDLDDTILDFHRAERVALEKTLHAFHIAPTPELFQGYSRINLNLWHRLERGEVTRQQVLDGRFRRFAQEYELSQHRSGWQSNMRKTLRLVIISCPVQKKH